MYQQSSWRSEVHKHFKLVRAWQLIKYLARRMMVPGQYSKLWVSFGFCIDIDPSIHLDINCESPIPTPISICYPCFNYRCKRPSFRPVLAAGVPQIVPSRHAGTKYWKAHRWKGVKCYAMKSVQCRGGLQWRGRGREESAMAPKRGLVLAVSNTLVVVRCLLRLV